ncbi:uncharacterized protein LOC119737400 isoform X1 [Patiria miniata]|uniref:PDZ domain-containing protein n=2 Tax=Patiria miniata TaxID=46514 RepID=A0A914AVD8_PATMI|nr:uncharacterized protein LOC119737400 isoform X1 [Patiria miniata]
MHVLLFRPYRVRTRKLAARGEHIFCMNMGNVARKRQKGTSPEKVTQSPDEAACEQRSAQETHQANAPEFGGPMFLPNFKAVGGKLVDFDADLNDIDGQYVLQNVAKDGLAYSAGFRTGDKLFQINGTNIEGFGIEFILDLLRTFHGYQVPQLMLAVERKPEIAGEPSLFIWVIFKVVWQDGIPKIEVIQTLENDTDEMPFIVLGPSFAWRGPPVVAYDIYIDGKQQLYLSIQKDKVVFTTYSKQSIFHGYSYYGGQPRSGNVLAYSLQPLKPNKKQPESTTPVGTAGNTVSAMDFPKYMLNKKDIPTDPRFWYQKHYQNGFSLESVVAKGMYLAMAPNGEAMLSTKQTELKVNKSMTTASKWEPSSPAMTK